ncbi:MAG: phosphoadenylyl-sulfate reductase [Opitutus sp.]|nr:phosphoadenylyl-sulfate reductase [Opitutus sp.]
MATAEKVSPAVDVAAVNALLASASAEDRIAWAAREFGETLVLSSSFGAQAAVMLSLAAAVLPNIPVVLIDTGYLFPETYRFADELATRLKLNLKVYRAPLSPAWLEARHGQLWEQGLEGLTRYNQLVKVEPMQRALRELGARAWLAGLRRAQSSTRGKLEVVGVQDGRVKVHPIIDWSDRDIHRYLTKHGLPYHPLWEKDYVSIGDTHSSRPLTADLTPEQTRFFGLKRECGLHEETGGTGI